MLYRFIKQALPARMARLIVTSFVVAAWGFLLGLVAVAIGVSQIASVVVAGGAMAAITGGSTALAHRGQASTVATDAAAVSAGSLVVAAILQFYGV